MNEKRKQLANQFVLLHGFLVRQSVANQHRDGISPYKGQGRVLAILKMQPEIGQKELGYLLDMSKQALAELLSKLEKNGYITRIQSEKDRRSFIIKLTDKGREALPNDDDETDETGIEDFFDCLNDEEQTNLLDYIERIIQTFTEKNGADDDYAEFVRQRFFARHGHHGHHGFRGGFFGGFGGFRGFDPRRGFGGFRDKHDDDE